MPIHDARAAAASSRALGAYGEDVAARHLTGAGMVLLDRNWRCREGELDLVLRDGLDLVVCEVKTRSSLACGTPHEAVGPDRVHRLRRLGERWLAEHAAHPHDLRVDLVAIVRPRTGAATIEHVRGIG
jgi:putative endonuclease